MTSAGTETTTISLPDATTGSALLVKEGSTACVSWASEGPATTGALATASDQGRRDKATVPTRNCRGSRPGYYTRLAGERRRPGPREKSERRSSRIRGGGGSKERVPIGRRRAANAVRQNRPRVGGNKEASTQARSSESERGRQPSAACWSLRGRPGARADGSPLSGAPGT